MTTTQTIALSALEPGDIFTIDGGEPVTFVRLEEDENSGAVRITVSSPEAPASRVTIGITDISSHALHLVCRVCSEPVDPEVRLNGSHGDICHECWC